MEDFFALKKNGSGGGIRQSLPNLPKLLLNIV